MRLALLVDDPVVLRTLHTCLRHAPGCIQPPCFVRISSWSHLLTLAGDGGCDLALVDPCCGFGTPLAAHALPMLERLAAVLARDRAVLLVHRRPPGAPDLDHLSVAGFPYLFERGVHDDPRQILRPLARAEVRRRLESGPVAVSMEIPDSESRLILLAALTWWPPFLRAAELASRLALHLRTIERRLARAFLPPPRESITWGTLLEASTLRGWGAGSWNRIALLMDLSGGADLAHRHKRLTGMRLPTTWSEDPFRRTVQLLGDRLVQARKMGMGEEAANRPRS